MELAHEIAPDHPLVTALHQSVCACGIPSEVYGWNVSCDARLYAKLAGLPTVVYGVSDIREAHSDGEKVLWASLNLEFAAINAPDLYRFGLYQQAQQDGRLSGRLQVGKDERAGEFICYRDHSWGHRPMGVAAGWTIASVPGRFYVIVAETPGQPVCFGRFTRPDGQFVPVHTPQIAAVDEGWSITDPGAGIGTWHVKRLAPPFEVYLGPAGQETLRNVPRPGDLYLDEIGPAHFISPEGEQVVGFLDQARGLT